MKFATYGTDGTITGHYDEEIHGSRYLATDDGGYVANPDTQIPAGAIELTDAEWEASCAGELWIEPATLEKIIKPDRPSAYHVWAGGLWSLTAGELSSAGLALCVEIDQVAGAARAKYSSPGEFIDQEYLEAYDQAKLWADGGYVESAPEMVQSWADAKGWTAPAAADDIVAAKGLLRGKMEAARRIRLVRRENIRNIAIAAVDPGTGEVTDQTAVDRMQAERDLALQELAAV